MIARYTRAEIGAIFTDQRRLESWLEVEVAALEAWAELGTVPGEAVSAIRAAAHVDVARVLEIEERTHHDVIAFTESIAEQVGEPHSRWFHYGLTSSDVVDTGLALQLRDAGEVVVSGIDRLLAALGDRAREFRRTPCMGRTHGVHAEPTTFGLKLLSHYCEIERDRERVAAAFAAVAVGKLSGAVGAYGNIDPRIEERALGRLGLDVEPASTQVVARDRHAALLTSLAILGSSLDRLATEIRHLQRSEVREAFEPFGRGQKGSSAMPHKRNPIVCERITGLARVLRGNAVAGLENVALWHERDISHSSAERVILGDSAILADYVLDRAAWVVAGLEVDAQRMLANIDGAHGLPFSGRALLRIVEAGLTREAAYEIVQRNAMRAWDSGEHLRELLVGDSDLAGVAPDVIASAFALDDVLEHVDIPFTRVRSLEALDARTR